VQWRGLSGKKFLTFSEAYRQDAKELFSVEVTLVVRDSSVGNVTCSILNPILGQEKAMAIFIPGQCCSALTAELRERMAFPSVLGWVSWDVPLMSLFLGHRALLPSGLSWEASFHCELDFAWTPTLWGWLFSQKRTFYEGAGVSGTGESAEG
jgi:hypothetical protein